ncbi:MAG TPA: hypothetical protein PKY82_01125 [Pyrinomonadaceae bacterium]|nr:hypothetical protein [Pyrinomonadaceae bacterium]
MRKVLFIKLVLLLLALTVSAQSGRRTPPTVSTPNPVPETTPTPQPTPESAPKSKYIFRVLRNIPLSLYQQFIVPENSQKWVADRLKSSILLEVELGGESNRKEAIKLAKESEQTYIILISLSQNEMADGSHRAGSSNSQAKNGEITVSYDIFSPKTGKTAYSGITQLGFKKTSGVIGKTTQKLCYPSNVYGDDFLLLESSYEVAERIMSNFNVPIPPLCKR